MARSTRSLPDCTGRCSWWATCLLRAMVSNNLGVASLGWEDMNRMR